MSQNEVTTTEPAIAPLFDRSGGFTPLDNPYMNPNRRVRPVPTWHWPVVIGLTALAVAYSVTCLWRVYLTTQDMDVVRRLFASPTSTDIDQFTALVARGRTAGNLNTIVFYGLLVALLVFVTQLPKALARAGRPGALRSVLAYRVWRICIYASFALAIAMTVASKETVNLSGYLSNARHLIVYLSVRAALGAVYAWVFVSMGIAASKAYRTPIASVTIPSPDVDNLANAPE